MGTSQEEWDWEITCESWWDDTLVGEERGKLYEMETHRPPTQDEPILVFYRDFEAHVTRWDDMVAEDQWPITRSEKGYWMRFPNDPRGTDAKDQVPAF